MSEKVLGGLLGGILAAPFIEEAAKGLGLLALVLLLRDEFDGPRDGFIYGALVGLGFTWLESSVYIARSFGESGTVAWGFQLGSRYVLAGLNGHAIYTGIFGLFLGFALIQKRWPRKIPCPSLATCWPQDRTWPGIRWGPWLLRRRPLPSAR